MDESEDTMSSDDLKNVNNPSAVKKPKKRSLVERELETNLTARVTSPVTSGDGTSTSRYGRSRRLKTDSDFCDTDKAVSKALKSPNCDKTAKVTSPVYKMHASNSLTRTNSTERLVSLDTTLENQIENIYNANISLSRFGTEGTKLSPSPVKKFPKVYIRKDLIQTKEKEETVTLIKNMFSPVKSYKQTNSHLSNVLERSSEKYMLNGNVKQNGYLDNSSVVKTLDFDSGKKKKKDNKDSKTVLSKSDLFELEAKCEYQVGDLAWARMGTYPFWPCIVTREPVSEFFVKKKLFGRIERDIIHVTFFGDNGRRSWVVDTMLRKFLGLLDFETTRDQFTPEDKKKDPRLYAAFFISEKKQALWKTSVEEAETLLREPKRLRIDLFTDLLEKSRTVKVTPKQMKSGKVRTDNDVPLSESLYDTLFSDDDGKTDDTDRSRNKTRNKSLDVSEVVTACLDNMAAKTGMIKIQKQSHMDRWLQKAKSKTPEKLKVTVTVERLEKDAKDKAKKEAKNSDSKKKKIVRETPSQKPYRFRRSVNESQNLLSHHNEHDYSIKTIEDMEKCFVKLKKSDMATENIKNQETEVSNETDKSICVIDKVRTLRDSLLKDKEDENSVIHEESVDSNKLKETNECNDIDKINKKDVEKESTEIPSSEIKGDHVSPDANTEIEKSNKLGSDDTILDTTDECDFQISTKLTEDVEIPDIQITTEIKVEQIIEMPEKNDNEIIEENDNDVVTKEDSDKLLTSELSDKVLCHQNLEESGNSQSVEIDQSILTSKEPNDVVIEVNNDTSNINNDSNDIDMKDCESDITSNAKDVVVDNAANEDVQDDPRGNDITVVATNKNVIQNGPLESLIEHVESEGDDSNNYETTSLDDICEENEKVNDLNSKISAHEERTETDQDKRTENVDMSAEKPIEIDNYQSTETSPISEEDQTASDKDKSIETAQKSVTEPTEKDQEIPTKSNVETSEEINSGTVLNNNTEKEFVPQDIAIKIIDKPDSIAEKGEKILDNEMECNEDAEGKTISEELKTKDCSVKDGGENTINEGLNSQDGDRKNNDAEIDASEENLPKIVSVVSEPIEDAIFSTKDKESSVKEINSNIPDNTLLLNETSEPILENGFHYDDELPSVKCENLHESETDSVASEFDEISLSELKLRSRTLNSQNQNGNLKKLTKDKQFQNDVSNEECDSNTVPQIDTIDDNLPKIVKVKTEKNMELAILVENMEVEKTLKERRLSLRKPGSPSNVSSEVQSKDTSPERKQDEDADTTSINSECSNISTKRKRKDKNEKIENLKDPEFLKYLELRQDALIDEHPELTADEIQAYLYKTWLYEDSLKTDQKKSDDIEQSNLVKGQEPTKPRKQKKVLRKLINIDKVLSQDLKKTLINKDISSKPTLSKEITKNKPKRKTSQPYYNEDLTDIEDEIEMFEIFNNKSKDKVSKTESPLQPNTTVAPKTDNSTEVLKSDTTQIETIDLDDYDEAEAYFEQLTKPKPNIFKGLVREKVCEICEKTNNLIKCKGCHGMFHVDCVKKVSQTVEVPMPTKGRKKKKKPRGRKPKVSTDSNGVDSESQSDEKSQDISEDFNVSIEETESERIVTDAELLETQLSTKMKELLETVEPIDYELYSTDEELDWKDVKKPGKCKIVDVQLKPRSKPIELDFKCNNCLKHDQPICFVCKSIVSPKAQNVQRQKCQIAHCHKYYHLECLEQWPQTQFNSGEPSKNNKKISEFFEALSCPRHVCHTCVCDDPRGCKTRFSGDKLARCVRCPATYHSFTKCLPAGTMILTASQIICPRHYEHRPGKVPCHVNTGWCFICALGGSLICCEYCPTSFHAECLNIKPPEGGYMCEDCETGRLPLYGEIVWVKLGHYRWWPGLILHPCEIPDNIMAVKHSLGEFVVRFFGQYDHYWVNRGRVFPFQEGDSGKVSGQKSKIDEAFTVAMEHAQRAFTLLKSIEPNEVESLDIASSLLPPHYVKLRVNKPCGSLCGRRVDVEESSLTQCECDPNVDEPCGLYSHCLNRMLLTECGPTCRAGDRCHNRAFEKRQYPKLVPYRTPHRGWGLKTLEDIKAGQFVIEYVGELIDEEEFQRRMRRKHEIRDENFYFLTLDKERMIDAGPKGNSARFMNHCCEPNCETQKWTVLGDVRVGLFAINDIPANSEVTFNYNLECAGIEKKRCLCGAKRCSGYIGAKPKQDETQSKKGKIAAKRTYKKRKNVEESPSTSQAKPKRPVGRPAKPRELTEIEKDLLIIKNATNNLSSDSECSRLSSVDGETAKALKRKRVSFSTEENDSSRSPSVKRLKMDSGKVDTGD